MLCDGVVHTIPGVLDRVAAELPHQDAVIAGGRVLTFAALRAEVRRAAAALMDLGIEPGDRVAIWMPNTWQWVVTGLAIHYTGAVLIPLNTRFTAREARDILARTGAPLLITADGFLASDRAADLDRTTLPALRHVVRIGAQGQGWDRFAGAPRTSLRQVEIRAAGVDPDDVSDIFFTSGTTGRSKGVPCSHRQSLAATAAVWAATGSLSSADRYLCVNPFFHTFGYRFGIVACLLAGATLVAEPAFDPQRILDLIDELRITVVPGPPVVFQMLLDHPTRPHHDLSSWRLAVTGATTLPVVLVERMQRELDVDVVTGYGLTEVSGFGTTCRPGDPPVTVATSCGRPIPGLEVRIGDPDESGVGEVLLRGAHVMTGYLDDPIATAEAIDRDGWLRTGDLGTVDPRGNVRITGRIKDMFICAGLNVYPAEVEQTLARLEGVSEVAVIGVPDALRGEVGRAFIVLKPDARIDERSVIAYARSELADFKVPSSVVFCSELPRNASGKVIKAELRSHIESGVRIGRGTPAAMSSGSGGPPVGLLENWIADTWRTLLGIARPGRQDRFTDLGGDSLSALDFLRILDMRYGVAMSLDAFAARPTIAALVSDLKPGSGAVREPITRLRADGDGPVYLIAPGLNGHAWGFSALAQAISAPCDVLALSTRDVTAGRTRHIRQAIRDSAFSVLRDRRLLDRPIILVGFSFGALVAADLGCWLMQQAVPIERVCLLDPSPLGSGRFYRHRIERRWAANSIVRKLRKRSWYANDEASRSAAARAVEKNAFATANKLVFAYLDGSVRLPRTRVSCLMTTEVKRKEAAATTFFGTPMAQVDVILVECGHGALITTEAGVSSSATWLDQCSQTMSGAAP